MWLIHVGYEEKLLTNCGWQGRIEGGKGKDEQAGIMKGLELCPLYNWFEMARFRCGNEERGLEHWRGQRDMLCRICGQEEETVEHLVDACCPTDMSEERIRSEFGHGVLWMREVYGSRWADQL